MKMRRKTGKLMTCEKKHTVKSLVLGLEPFLESINTRKRTETDVITFVRKQ